MRVLLLSATMVLCCLASKSAGQPASHQQRSVTGGSVVTPQMATQARARLKAYFDRQRVTYPPSRLRLLATKEERRLKLFAPDHTGEWRFLLQYPISAASGKPGPKLRKGDEQVPEGMYRISSLNPGSKFHLSMALNYPNEFDRKQAKADKRKHDLGGDIMIHGKCTSSGCLAVGDTAAEDLYVLVSDTGLSNVDLILAPLDFRRLESVEDATPIKSQPKWVLSLYKEIAREMKPLNDAGVSTSSLLVQYADSNPYHSATPQRTGILSRIMNAFKSKAK